MIIDEQEVSLTRVFLIVGVIVFVSSLIYISVMTSKLVSQKRINDKANAKEKILQLSTTPTPAINP